MTAKAFFLPDTADAASRRFCIHHPPASGGAEAPRANVVYIHPFAEEMNKSRRMAALQSRALAATGCSVLQIDLLGCGDSSGDFGDATWRAWVADVGAACRWLQRRAEAPLWLWGLRAGCLVAADAARELGTPCNFLFWQAPAAGKPLLQQFLRLKLAADLAAGKGVMEGLRRELAGGAAVEIAGYALGPGLALGLEQARLTPPAATPAAGRVEWIELSTRADATLLPASEAAVATWRDAGWQVHAQVAHGPAFWQTVEIEEAPALVDATLAAFDATPAVFDAAPVAFDAAGAASPRVEVAA